MKKLWALCLCFLFVPFSFAQIISPENDVQAIQDSLQALSKREIANDSLKVHYPVINDYTFWRENDNHKSVIDTALTINSFYNQNFTQKDIFGKMFFPNFGQTFNPLEYQNSKFGLQLLPQGKSYNYLYAEDIQYFDVKTPITEFIYENGLKEGQYLSTTFAHNLNPQLNYSVRYRGLRSEGRYQNNLSSNNAFIANINFHSKNDKIKFWTHFASQNIDNEENAGIQDLNEFENDDELRTTNRQNITVNLNSAYTEFDSRRFHLGATYALFGKSKTDSTQSTQPLLFKNVFTYEKQKYLYNETANENYFPSAVFSDVLRRNLKSFESLKNTSSIQFNWTDKLLVEAGFRYENVKLYSGSELVQSLIYVPGQLDDNLMGAIGRLYFDWNERLKLTADAEFKSGNLFKNQYHFNAELDIQPLNGYHIIAGALLESSFPSLNLFYNQSFYKDYNYYNYSFENTNTQKLFGKLNLEKLNTEIEANFYNIDDFVYVGTDFKPKQLDGSIALFQIKASNLLTYRKFNLATTAEYQKVTKNEDFLPLPEIIARASLFWQSKVFQNKAEMQVGINANYFTKFQSREFFPVINEFMLQRTNDEFGIQEIGDFPIIDLFINLKVDRMRIYIRADHFNALWGKNNYYSAPFTPFRDFKFQFGVKWYLFT